MTERTSTGSYAPLSTSMFKTIYRTHILLFIFKETTEAFLLWKTWGNQIVWTHRIFAFQVHCTHSTSYKKLLRVRSSQLDNRYNRISARCIDLSFKSNQNIYITIWCWISTRNPEMNVFSTLHKLFTETGESENQCGSEGKYSRKKVRAFETIFSKSISKCIRVLQLF